MLAFMLEYVLAYMYPVWYRMKECRITFKLDFASRNEA